MEDSESELTKVGRFSTLKVDAKRHKYLSSETTARTYRTSISNQDEAQEWLEAFSKLTRTEWIVSQTYPSAQRLKYHKKFICAFSTKNKRQPEGISKRNYSCDVLLNIQIKLLTVDSKKKDALLRQDPPLCGVITVTGEHKHNKSCTVLQYLRPGKDIKEIFLEYFHDMSPSVALRVYLDTLKCRDDYEEVLADGHITPLDNSVYYWHKQWRILNYGPLNDPLQTLENKIHIYKENGATVVVRSEKPWAVLVATPVMKRAQALPFCRGVVFSDTSASCDSTSANVTLMLTATKAGAVPLCVLIHEAQTEESYTTAFAMYKETFPNGFGGATHPHVFMTDNSPAEKNSLASIWEQTLQILCGFHVGQAEWTWLEKHFSKDVRQKLMKAFQQIQYAPSTEALEESIEHVKDQYPEYYDRRISKVLEKKEEWVQLFRDSLPIGGHHTNNYAEATVRVLKDIILGRIKAYNIVALVDYIVNGWENYLESRLSKYAYKRISKPMHLYNDLVNRLPAALAEKIQVIDEDTYHVPSSTTGEATYEVIASAGSCMCRAGAAGAFCKHQALVHQKFGKMFPNQPLICSADRYLIGQVAFGEKCPRKEFFLDPKESIESFQKDLDELCRVYSHYLPDVEPTPMEIVVDSTSNQANLEKEDDKDSESEDEQELLEKFTREWERVCKLGTETNKSGFKKFLKRSCQALEKVKNSNKAFEAMMKTSAALKGNVARTGKKIKVQPTSIARRRPGLTKGNSRVPTGRPPNCLRDKLKPKRKHVLSQSVAMNKPHAK